MSDKKNARLEELMSELNQSSATNKQEQAKEKRSSSSLLSALRESLEDVTEETEEVSIASIDEALDSFEELQSNDVYKIITDNTLSTVDRRNKILALFEEKLAASPEETERFLETIKVFQETLHKHSSEFAKNRADLSVQSNKLKETSSERVNVQTAISRLLEDRNELLSAFSDMENLSARKDGVEILIEMLQDADKAEKEHQALIKKEVAIKQRLKTVAQNKQDIKQDLSVIAGHVNPETGRVLSDGLIQLAEKELESARTAFWNKAGKTAAAEKKVATLNAKAEQLRSKLAQQEKAEEQVKAELKEHNAEYAELKPIYDQLQNVLKACDTNEHINYGELIDEIRRQGNEIYSSLLEQYETASSANKRIMNDIRDLDAENAKLTRYLNILADASDQMSKKLSDQKQTLDEEIADLTEKAREDSDLQFTIRDKEFALSKLETFESMTSGLKENFTINLKNAIELSRAIETGKQHTQAELNRLGNLSGEFNTTVQGGISTMIIRIEQAKNTALLLSAEAGVARLKQAVAQDKEETDLATQARAAQAVLKLRELVEDYKDATEKHREFMENMSVIGQHQREAIEELNKTLIETMDEDGQEKAEEKPKKPAQQPKP